MPFHRVFADQELVSDPLVRKSIAGKPQDADLPDGQRGKLEGERGPLSPWPWLGDPVEIERDKGIGGYRGQGEQQIPRV